MLKIKSSSDFRSIYGGGHKRVMRDFVVFFRKNDLSQFRYGITVSKKVGNAVVRNRTKRRLNAALSSVFVGNNEAYDIVFVARKTIIETEYAKIITNLESVKSIISQHLLRDCG